MRNVISLIWIFCFVPSFCQSTCYTFMICMCQMSQPKTSMRYIPSPSVPRVRVWGHCTVNLALSPPPSPSPLSSDCVLASCRYILHLHDPRSPPAGEARHRPFHTAFTSSVRLMFSRDKILHCALWRCSLCVLVSHTNTHARIHKGARNVHICRGIFCQFFSIFLVHCVLSPVTVHPSVFPWRRWCAPSAICEERERKWRCNFTFCILSRCSKLDEFC